MEWKSGKLLSSLWRRLGRHCIIAWGILGDFEIFYGEDRSIPELKGSMGASERSKWSEDSAFEQAEAHFSVVTWGLTGFSEWTLMYINLHGSTLYICRSSTLQDSNSDDNTHTKVVIGRIARILQSLNNEAPLPRISISSLCSCILLEWCRLTRVKRSWSPHK